MNKSIKKLRCYLAIIQAVSNRAFGIEPGIKSDISPVESFIIYRCNFFKVNMKDLQKANKVAKSTTSHYIDMLEKKGYVIRVKDEEDKRNVIVVPTAKAKAWITETEEKVFDYVEGGMSRLTPEEQDKFIELFSKFVGEKESTSAKNIMKSISVQNVIESIRE